MREENNKSQKKHSFVNGFLKMAVLCVAVFVAWKLVEGQIVLSQKQEIFAKLEKQKQEISIANAEKKELIEKSDQNEFVERIAREYFNFAYPDEQIYIDISGN